MGAPCRGALLPASPSASPRFSTMMQMCLRSWRGLENLRQHLLHSRLLPSSGARTPSAPGRVLRSASSSSGLGFFVDPLGLPLFLFMTENSAEETRGHRGVTEGNRVGHALGFQAWKYVCFHGELTWYRIHLQCRRPRFHPHVGKSPGEGDGYPPPQHSCLENSMDGDAWPSYSPWGRQESDRTEQLTLLLPTFYLKKESLKQFQK